MASPTTDISNMHSSSEYNSTVEEDDTHSRLMWVCVPMTEQCGSPSSRFYNDNKEDVVIWWPALKFRNYNELLDKIPPTNTTLISQIFLNRQSCPILKKNPQCPLAFLLGNSKANRPMGKIVLAIPDDKYDNITKNFYTHMEYFTEKYKNKNSSWSNAVEEACERVKHAEGKRSSSEKDYIINTNFEHKLHPNKTKKIRSIVGSEQRKKYKTRTIDEESTCHLQIKGTKYTIAADFPPVQEPSGTKRERRKKSKSIYKKEKCKSLHGSNYNQVLHLKTIGKIKKCSNDSPDIEHNDGHKKKRSLLSHDCNLTQVSNNYVTIDKNCSSTNKLLDIDQSEISIVDYLYSPSANEKVVSKLENISPSCLEESREIRKSYYVSSIVGISYQETPESSNSKFSLRDGSELTYDDDFCEDSSVYDNHSQAVHFGRNDENQHSLEISMIKSLPSHIINVAPSCTGSLTYYQGVYVDSKGIKNYRGIRQGNIFNKMGDLSIMMRDEKSKITVLNDNDNVDTTVDNLSLDKGSEENDNTLIITDEDAWELLLNYCGFCCNQNTYFYPGYCNERLPQYTHGYEYFTDLKSLRRNLCAYGLSSVPNNIPSQKKEALKNWINLAYIDQMVGMTRMPPHKDYDKIGFTKSFNFLKILGVHHCKGRYYLPGVNSRIKGIKDGTDFFEVNGYKNLLINLARFGIPFSEKLDLSERDKLSLLFYVHYYEGGEKRNIFSRIYKFENNTGRCGLTRDYRYRDINRYVKVKTKSPQGISNIFSNNNNDNAHVLKGEKQKKEDGENRFFENDNSDKKYLRKVVQHLPTIREQLQNILTVVNPSFLTVDTHFNGTSQSGLSSNIKKLMTFLEDSLENYQHNGRGCSSLIYVCGSPGTGKTTIVNQCVRLISQKFQEKVGKASPLCKYINLVHKHLSGKTVLSEIAESIGKRSTEVSKLEQWFQVKLRNNNCGPMILILDEIDFMVISTRNEREKTESSALTTLFRWASDPQFKLILIGISNSVGNKEAKRLYQLGKFDEEIIFESYGEHDLIEIIKCRLKKNTFLIDDSVMTYVSRRVSKTSGDARRALELICSAVEKSEEELDDNILDQISNGESIVKLYHVMKALRDSGEMPLSQIIASLPQVAKVVLCVAMALSQVSPLWKVFKLSELKMYCAEATRHNVMEHVSIDALVDIVRNLEDADLLKIGESEDIYHNSCVDPLDWKLRLGVQLDDVECAIGESLLQNIFYKNLVRYVRNKVSQDR